ncbi:MAG: hypothetical protein LBJ23_01605 [Tannerella sp.]|jgi:hypothetical protein|nr:hypothetical protein [Tannerella sp.]
MINTSTNMNNSTIIPPSLFFAGNQLTGDGVECTTRTAGELKDVSPDGAAPDAVNRETVVYEVKTFCHI